MDGERHARLRRLLMPAFSSRRMAQVEADIAKIIEGMLDDIERDGPAFDAMTRLWREARGRRACDHHDGTRRGAAEILLDYQDMMPVATATKPGQPYPPECQRAFKRRIDLAHEVIAERRASPRSDFLSDLVHGARPGRQAERSGTVRHDLRAVRRARRHQPLGRRRALYALYAQRPARAVDPRPGAYPGRDRGMPAHRQQRLLHVRAHRHPRHRGRRHGNPQGHGGAAVAARGELRSRCVSRSAALRHPSQAETDSQLCRRARITASATSSAAPPSPSRSAGCWRAFPTPGWPIRTSCRSMAGPSANCACKAFP